MLLPPTINIDQFIWNRMAVSAAMHHLATYWTYTARWLTAIVCESIIQPQECTIPLLLHRLWPKNLISKWGILLRGSHGLSATKGREGWSQAFECVAMQSDSPTHRGSGNLTRYVGRLIRKRQKVGPESSPLLSRKESAWGFSWSVYSISIWWW